MESKNKENFCGLEKVPNQALRKLGKIKNKMTKFYCKNCNYKFNLETLTAPKRCPFCGKENIVKEESAEEIVEKTT